MDNFTTNCLDFFTNNIPGEVIVLKKDDSFISKHNIQQHTNKRIREAHNIQKMLKGDLFNWIKNK